MVSWRIWGCRAANRLIYNGYLSFCRCSSFIHLVLSPVVWGTLFFPFCEVFVERDRRRAFVAGAKLKLTAKTFLAAERRIPGLGNGVLQGILFQACIYLKRMFAALDEGVAERLFGTSLSFVRKIPPCAPPAVQAAMRAVEFVKSFAVLAHVQVARVALRAARGVEPLLVILENHEVEQAQ